MNLFIGILYSNLRYLFVLFNREGIHKIILQIDEKAQVLRDRSKDEPEVGQICEKYYKRQRVFFLSCPTFEFINCTIILLEAVLVEPLGFVMGDLPVDPGSLKFYFVNAVLYITVIFTDCNYIFTDLMLGGLFMEIAKLLEVVHYDLKQIVGRGLNSDQKQEKLIEVIKNYQEVERIQKELSGIISWFLGVFLAGILILITFVCVELSIVINESTSDCFEPAFYLLFVQINLFYWCWLGNKLLTMSENIVDAALDVYDPEVDDKVMQKLTLMFHQMIVNRPIVVRVPLFTFDYELFVAVSG